MPHQQHGGAAMRFMIVVKATKDTEAGIMPGEKLIAEMATYHEELAKAGVLLDANGLQPTSKGFRIRYSGGKRTVIDGPFTEAKELIAGYTIIEVKSRDRKSTRLNSSHLVISYAVFCLKKKK